MYYSYHNRAKKLIREGRLPDTDLRRLTRISDPRWCCTLTRKKALFKCR